MKKLFPIVLAIVFAVSLFMAGTAFAAAGEQSASGPLAASLAAGAESLSAGESTPLTLTLTNTSATETYKVSGAVEAVSGASLANSTLAATELAPGEAATLSATLTADGSASPKTDDPVSPLPWVILAAASGTLLLVWAVKTKKASRRGVMCILLCLVLVGSAVGLQAPAKAAATAQSVTTTIKIGGVTVTVTANYTSQQRHSYAILPVWATENPDDGPDVPKVSGYAYEGDNISASFPAADGVYMTKAIVNKPAAGLSVSVTPGTASADGTLGFTMPDGDVEILAEYIEAAASPSADASASASASPSAGASASPSASASASPSPEESYVLPSPEESYEPDPDGSYEHDPGEYYSEPKPDPIPSDFANF